MDFDDPEENTAVTQRRFEAALEDAESAKARADKLEQEIRKYLEEK